MFLWNWPIFQPLVITDQYFSYHPFEQTTGSNIVSSCSCQILPGCCQVCCVWVHVLGDLGHRFHHRYGSYQPVQYGIRHWGILLHVVWPGLAHQTPEEAAENVSIVYLCVSVLEIETNLFLKSIFVCIATVLHHLWRGPRLPLSVNVCLP